MTKTCPQCERLKAELKELAIAVERNFKEKREITIYLNFIIRHYDLVIENINKSLPEVQKMLLRIDEYNERGLKYKLEHGIEKPGEYDND